MIIETKARPSRFKYKIEQATEVNYNVYDNTRSYTIKEYFEYID